MMVNLRRDDTGITLIELLVYIMLAAIVGTIVASILINSLRVQVQIQDAAASAQGTYLVADAMGTAVRDSTGLSQTTLADGTLLVRTRSLNPSEASTTTSGPANFVCYAFAFAGSNIRFTTSSTAIADPSPATLQSWPVIADGVEPLNATTPVFEVLTGGTALRLALISQLGAGGPHQLSTVIRSLQGNDPVTGGRATNPCF